MTQRQQIIDKLKELEDILPAMKEKHPEIKDITITTVMKSIDNSFTEEQLKNIMLSEAFYQAFLLKEGKETAKVYAELGISQAALPAADSATKPAGQIDFGAALTTALGAAGLAFAAGKGFKGALMAGLLAGGGVLGLTNMDEIQAKLGPMLSGLGDGGKDLLGGFGDLLGKDGLGAILKGGGDILSGLVDNPQLKGMFDYFKKNPVTSIGVTAMIAMVGGKLMAGDFAGIFSMIPSLLGVMAMTFFASSFLKMDGQSPQIPYGTQQFAANELPILERAALTMNAQPTPS